MLDIFAGNYSVYGFEMQLSRSLGPFILSIYLPSAMFVTMSWVAFFVPPDIVPARIVLLVTLCLVLVNMFNYIIPLIINYIIPLIVNMINYIIPLLLRG